MLGVIDPPSTGVTLPAGYGALLAQVKAEVAAARVRDTRAAHAELLALIWRIGRLILDQQNQLGWGGREGARRSSRGCPPTCNMHSRARPDSPRPTCNTCAGRRRLAGERFPTTRGGTRPRCRRRILPALREEMAAMQAANRIGSARLRTWQRISATAT